MEFNTIFGLLDRSVKLYPNNTLTLDKVNGEWTGKTYTQVRDMARNFGAGLIQLGIQKGDRLALLSEGRSEWLISELGILYARAINVPLSIKLIPDPEVTFRVQHSGARYLIVSGTQATRIGNVCDNINIEGLIYLDEKPEGAKGYSFEEILKNGEEWLKNADNLAAFEASIAEVTPDDLVNISYTSGTTSDPKGVMLSHGNYATNTIQSCTAIHIEPTDITFTILPWDHSFAHTTNLYCFIYFGASVASQEIGKSPMETLRNIPKNMKEVRPTLMMSVPALSKSFRKNIEAGIKAKGNFVWNMFEFFRKVAYIYNAEYFNAGHGLRWLLWPIKKLGDKIIMSKISETFGGRLKYFIGGGALLDVELQRFFAAVGIPVMQGYGLSEASPVISANLLDACKFGSSGRPFQFLECKILDENNKEVAPGQKGEVCVKGGNVMKGYWKNEEATASTIVDGWLHTGDMGYIDEDGFLFVQGRFKSLLISADGEKYSPEGIEECIVDLSSTIDQCMLHNNQCPYTVALIVPNYNALKAKLKHNHHIKPGTDEYAKEALNIIWNDVCQLRKGGSAEGLHPDRWLPATMGILPEPFTEQNKMLNSTMKMVRPKVTEHYSDLIEYLLNADNKDILNARNLETIKANLQ
ncbi:MAG: AMP-binding protein [Bacteroidales bacterium]|nr:AMP-binding protein [Bacteroidales bacterium]